MKLRILQVGLSDALELFGPLKWKFYEVRPDGDAKGAAGTVRIEVPRGSDEAFVVEIPYANAEQLYEVKDRLRKAGFIEQQIQLVSDQVV